MAKPADPTSDEAAKNLKSDDFVGHQTTTVTTKIQHQRSHVNIPIDMMLPGGNQPYYAAHHAMSRQPGGNYNYYQPHPHYNFPPVNGMYPYHDSYQNENFYELKKNKSSGDLLASSHLKEIEYFILFCLKLFQYDSN